MLNRLSGLVGFLAGLSMLWINRDFDTNHLNAIQLAKLMVVIAGLVLVSSWATLLFEQRRTPFPLDFYFALLAGLQVTYWFSSGWILLTWVSNPEIPWIEPLFAASAVALGIIEYSRAKFRKYAKGARWDA